MQLYGKAKENLRLRKKLNFAGPLIRRRFHEIGGRQPLVSVIVPNYNCERFLDKRLDSIINQTFKDIEIVILDDASSDNSLAIIEKYCHLPHVGVCCAKKNSGNTFVQWQKGFLQAKGDIVWFAEADDFCEVDFLEQLLPNFIDESIALAYCDSVMVDSSDNVTGDYSSYLNRLDRFHWASSYQVDATREINVGLGVKNTIPNASAVLIRRKCVSEQIFNETLRFKFSGDWYFYTQVIKGGNIAFCSQKMNYHRKHAQTVSSKFNTDRTAIKVLLNEAEVIHLSILENYPVTREYLEKWEYYIGEQILAFYPGTRKEEYDKYYPYSLIRAKIEAAVGKCHRGRRIVFVTTNDVAPNGGSEQLWIESARECRKRGHDVAVVIRKWDPTPYFIREFVDIGIQIVFKGSDSIARIVVSQPDVVVVSIGDMDEGVEWYDACRKHCIPYVIVNQLTKEPEYSPIKKDMNEDVKKGYLGASKVCFTCNNNRKVMEKRLNCKLSNATIHYNPFHVDRDGIVAFPSLNQGVRIAIPANLVRIHKGQDVAMEVFRMRKWRDRNVELHLYGEGADEDILKAMARDYNLNKVFFHKPVSDLTAIWRDNHAIFMPSFMEGLPVVLVGAMICARVPILTDIGGHREVVEDNVSGFIAAKPTVEALDDALERAYQKSERWEEMGKKARESILRYLPDDPIGHFMNIIVPLAKVKRYGECDSEPGILIEPDS